MTGLAPTKQNALHLAMNVLTRTTDENEGLRGKNTNWTIGGTSLSQLLEHGRKQNGDVVSKEAFKALPPEYKLRYLEVVREVTGSLDFVPLTIKQIEGTFRGRSSQIDSPFSLPARILSLADGNFQITDEKLLELSDQERETLGWVANKTEELAARSNLYTAGLTLGAMAAIGLLFL